MQRQALDNQSLKQMLGLVADRVFAAEALLSEADRELGDGDHGLAMARGFAALKERLAQEDLATASASGILSAAGTALLSTMGGASGALFGTFFRNGGKALEGREFLDAQALADFLEAGTSGVITRGGAKLGQKTMLDALQPASAKAREAASLPLGEAIEAIAAAAAAGRDATRAMQATAGRAQSLGAGSVGFPDPGAISVALIIDAMRDYILCRSQSAGGNSQGTNCRPCLG